MDRGARWVEVACGLVGMAMGLGVLGCGSDSENDTPAADGALSVVFQSIGTGGQTCTVAPHNAQLGTTDDSSLAELVTDGVGGAQISCRVVDQGGHLVAQGSMERGPTYLDFTVSQITAAASEGAPALGDVSYRSLDTVKLYASPEDPQCEFFFVNDQEIAPGRVWMQFTCPQIANAGSNSSCAISLGTIAMQRCEQ